MLKIGQYVVLNFTDKNMLSSFFTGHGVESRKRSHDYHRDLILPQSFCATSFILLSARYFQHVFLVLWVCFSALETAVQRSLKSVARERLYCSQLPGVLCIWLTETLAHVWRVWGVTCQVHWNSQLLSEFAVRVQLTSRQPLCCCLSWERVTCCNVSIERSCWRLCCVGESWWSALPVLLVVVHRYRSDDVSVLTADRWGWRGVADVVSLPVSGRWRRR